VKNKKNLDEIKNAIVFGDDVKIKKIVKNAIELKIPAEQILNNSLISGMNIVGKKYKQKEFFIPEVLISAKAMKEGMKLIRDKLLDKKMGSLGTVILGTIEGDMHEIGKNIVCIMLEANGFDVINLGGNVSCKKFADEVKKTGTKIVGISTLLTTTLKNIEKTIEFFKKQNVYENVKIIVGGAAVTEKFAKEINADGYAEDASSAVLLVKKLI
jgi:5-methyltetrahydrofolate--homocysteine methyltransferase